MVDRLASLKAEYEKLIMGQYDNPPTVRVTTVPVDDEECEWERQRQWFASRFTPPTPQMKE